MKRFSLKQLWQRARTRLPLRVQIAIWSGLLALIVSFTLLLFINTIALKSFHSILRDNPGLLVRIVKPSAALNNGIYRFQGNPLERSLLLELRSISLIGFGLMAIFTGIGAYFFAGFALRPLRRVSQAARQISARTLDTRLALTGPRDEVKELADTFDAMLHRLQQTFEQQGRFVADAAHELRTPLTSLRTNLEVVTADPEATLDDYREMATTQERALTRLERLVADLLLLAKSEQPLQRDEVALAPLLQEVCDEAACLARTQQVTVELRCDSDVTVQGDAALLQRVFSNLIENGIRYNRKGGAVVLTLDSKASHAIVRVSDTGIGIAPEQQPHIFERFYRVDCSRAQHNGGAGLGLSIVSAILQQHGGHIQVESTPDTGSSFTIVLPTRV